MGYKIKEVRESIGMTQEELAKKSGVSRGTIAALERDDGTTTSTKTLLKLAQSLGTTVHKIFLA